MTVDSVTYRLEEPFMVMATQNPVEFVGTYPLPEAQLDRFFMCISLGYPTHDEEVEILERYTSGANPIEDLQSVCTAADILELQQLVSGVYAAPEVRSYIASIAQTSRHHSALSLGVSTRGAIALLRASQAAALLDGRDYVIPEDVQGMCGPVLQHRLVLGPEARMKGLDALRVLQSVVSAVPVPVKLS